MKILGGDLGEKVSLIWLISPYFEPSEHTCHKLWIEICEIRQIFK